VERMTWLTEERIAASATGAPTFGCVAAVATGAANLQNQKQRGSVPAAYGPGLVGGSASVNLHTIDHVDMGRTAWDGTPLGSLGVGFG
jgi:hypothetical protein